MYLISLKPVATHNWRFKRFSGGPEFKLRPSAAWAKHVPKQHKRCLKGQQHDAVVATWLKNDPRYLLFISFFQFKHIGHRRELLRSP